MNKRLLFHCQFGDEYGWGHVVRCGALAQQAMKRGFTTHLWSSSDFSTLPNSIQKHFHQLVSRFSPLDYDALILDNPQAGQREVTSLWPIDRSTIIVIDDECTRDLTFADIIVNAALNAHTLAYPDSVSQKCLGEAYVLLRSSFKTPTPNNTQRTGIAIIMGGTDVLSLVPKILEYLINKESPFNKTPIQLIAPIRKETQSSIENHLSKSDHLTWHSQADAEKIAQIFQQSKLGITACGGTAYEMACCGLPFVGIVVAKNQQHFSRAIHNQWKMPIIDGHAITRSTLLESLQKLSNTPDNYAHIDGLGASRILEAIEKALRLRSAS